MSQPPRGPTRLRDGQLSGKNDELQRGGSVKRARQRVEAGLASAEQSNRGHIFPGPKGPVSRLPQFGHGQAERLRLPQISSRGQQPASVPPPIGAAISQPSPMSHWPLREEGGSPRKRNNSPTEDRSAGKGPPPQRPPRPSNVPSILDSAHMQESPYQHEGPQQEAHNLPSPSQQQSSSWADSYQLSPSRDSELLTATSTNSSRPSTLSSVGTIPEFPLPSMPSLPIQQQPRRSANLGPPPSSRRGASSYYSQASYVAPIPEEIPDFPQQNLHGSFASSHVIPTSWGDVPPGYTIGGEEDEALPRGEDEQRLRSIDDGEPAELVQKVSLGKRHVPSLTIVKNNNAWERDEMDRDRTDDANPGDETRRTGLVRRAAIPGEGAGALVGSGIVASRYGEYASRNGAFNGGTTMYEDSSSSSDTSSRRTLKDLKVDSPSNDPRSRSPATTSMDVRAKEILGSLERGGALPSSGTASPLTATTMGSEKAFRRPPPLNLNPAKETDSMSRGSMTSLPDLIRRATKLASNLDRGKTASRLGLFDMLSPSDSKNHSRMYFSASPRLKIADRKSARSGSISDILASFPPPGLSTPTSTGERPASRWPSPYANSALALGPLASPSRSVSGLDEKKQRGRHRCCGMPAWAFILVLGVLFILIAAAIIIPVILIVLPRQHAQGDAAAVTSCENITPCAHGGASIVAGNSCRCICSNGFTGATCAIIADNGCTTTNIRSNDQSSASFTNVTLGSSIPRLLSAAQTNFSIPLNSSTLLSLFSATNLSCTSENALVTFNGKFLRREIQLPLPRPGINLIEAKQIEATATSSLSSGSTIQVRDVPTSTQIQNNPVASTATGTVYTSNGIVFAAPSVANASPTMAATVSSPSPSGNSSLPISTQPSDISQRDLDFARVAVLYVLQETALDAAVAAQEKLQAFLMQGNFNGSTIGVGAGVVVDFEKEVVILQNGTSVGGKGSG
ncbi:hypothetical protein MMC06_003918 [Schaereria dolodes]|nr:hypothetical protein [Schaereria dolodes]